MVCLLLAAVAIPWLAEMLVRLLHSMAGFFIYSLLKAIKKQLPTLLKKNNAMRKKMLFFTIAIAAIAIGSPFACSKKVDGRTDDLAPLQPAKTDADAGNWKT